MITVLSCDNQSLTIRSGSSKNAEFYANYIQQQLEQLPGGARNVTCLVTIIKGQDALRTSSAVNKKLLMNMKLGEHWCWFFGYIRKYYTKETCKKNGIYKGNKPPIKPTLYTQFSNEVYFTTDDEAMDFDLASKQYIYEMEPTNTIKFPAYCLLEPICVDAE